MRQYLFVRHVDVSQILKISFAHLKNMSTIVWQWIYRANKKITLSFNFSDIAFDGQTTWGHSRN